MTVFVPFSGMITHDGTITFTHIDGRVYNVLPSNPAYEQVKAKLREVAAAEDDDTLRIELYDLSQPKTIVHASTGGRVRVENSVVLYDGKPVRNFIAERIIWMIAEGFDAAPMLAFLEKVKENPSNRAVDELYRFMEANKMGITRDGMILAYKRVRADFMDIYTGTIRNAIGDRPNMPRNEVNDNPSETCSHGLHVCAMSYLPSYRGAPGNHVMICSIHPRDVVSVPIEYHNAKMRVCAYEVIGEIEDHLDDILGRTPVWSERDNEDEWQDWNDDCDCGGDPSCDCNDSVEPVNDIHFSVKTIRDNIKRALGPDAGIFEPVAAFDFSEHVEDVRNRVIDVITESLGCAGGFPMDAKLSDLHADDLDAIKLVMDLEESFGVNLIDDKIRANTSMNEIIALMVALTA